MQQPRSTAATTTTTAAAATTGAIVVVTAMTATGADATVSVDLTTMTPR